MFISLTQQLPREVDYMKTTPKQDPKGKAKITQQPPSDFRLTGFPGPFSNKVYSYFSRHLLRALLINDQESFLGPGG